MENRLRNQLRDLKYEQRIEQITLLSRHDQPDERVKLATALICELAMHRLFDRFTKSQQKNLLDLLQPLTHAAEVENQPAFGQGAVSQLRLDFE